MSDSPEVTTRLRGSALTARGEAVVVTRTGADGGVDVVRIRGAAAGAVLDTVALPYASFVVRGRRPGILHVLAGGADDGELVTLAVEGTALRVIDRRSTGGAEPCHAALIDDRALAVANYTGGSVAIFDLDADGVPQHRTLVPLVGHGPDPERQESAHPHFVWVDADGLVDPPAEAVVVDLGADALRALRRVGDTWEVEELRDLHPGAGPRHAAAVGDRLVVVDELSGEVTALALARADARHTIASSERSGEGPVYPGDIVAPPGAVAVANRTRDTVAVIDVSERGELAPRVEWSTGAWPHQLGWDGERLVVLELHGGRLVRLDPRDGAVEVVLEGLVTPSGAVDLELAT